MGDIFRPELNHGQAADPRRDLAGRAGTSPPLAGWVARYQGDEMTEREVTALRQFTDAYGAIVDLLDAELTRLPLLPGTGWEHYDDQLSVLNQKHFDLYAIMALRCREPEQAHV